jgi:hypothetical protein
MTMTTEDNQTKGSDGQAKATLNGGGHHWDRGNVWNHGSGQYNLLSHLFGKALPNFSDAELEGLSWLSVRIDEEGRDIAQFLEDLGCMVLNDERAGYFSSPDGVSNLLWMLGRQIENLSGLARIMGDARDHLYARANQKGVKAAA